MPEFKTKEEYEKWKSKKLEESFKKASNKGEEVSSMPQLQDKWTSKVSQRWKIFLSIIGVLLFVQIIGDELLPILLIAYVIAYVVLWIYVLIDILRYEFTGSNKVIWKIFLSIIGVLLFVQIIGDELLPILLIAYVVLWIYVLIDILRYEFTGSNKVIWFLMVFFLPILGLILYDIIGQKQKIEKKT